MGVMECSRNSCDNIMCNTYISSVGYICPTCIDEFKEHVKANGKIDLTEYNVIKELKGFMISIPKGSGSADEIDIDEFFNKNTKN